MTKDSIVIVTGAAGFIGSCLAGYLNEQGFENLILVDEFDDENKDLNLHQKKYLVRVERENLFEWLDAEKPDVQFVFHLGARTDTTEFDYTIHQKLNVDYSAKIWDYCTQYQIPLVYASSAATYGSGTLGYNDDHRVVEKLQPLNPYGISKNEFDKWVLQTSENNGRDPKQPPFWAGLKFFNVYGPNEYHKARMASMIFHSFHQIKKNGLVKLFKSNSEDFKDGEQLRDFIYVKDLIKVCFWLMQNKENVESGLYNLGTGKARSFNDLVKGVFSALGLQTNILYIDMPDDIKDKYQNFTEANMQKLRNAGYVEPFCSLEEGVKDYVRNYLAENKYY